MLFAIARSRIWEIAKMFLRGEAAWVSPMVVQSLSLQEISQI